MVEEALHCGDEQKAMELYEWLQTESKNTEDVFSPMFTSMHPAGGTRESENEECHWTPNKAGWAPPEGTRDPPEYDPLAIPVHQSCTNEHDLNELHVDITNMVLFILVTLTV